MFRLTEPDITNHEIKAVSKAVGNCWGANAYSYIKKFEKDMCKYTGRKYAMATSSGTGALHLAMLALGIGKGDEVIVPEITYIATANVVSYVGAKPVFCDINPFTWCIDTHKIEKLITKRTKAIIPVDLFGYPVDMKGILKIAKKHHLYVIDDACEALGASYGTKKVGSEGDISVFSFEGTKTITTGQGGMLLTNNKKVYDKAVYFNDGTDKGHKHLFSEIAYSYCYSDLQASLGIAQLERLDEIVKKKRKVFDWYKDRLPFDFQLESDGIYSSRWFITAFIPGTPKETLVEKLHRKGIDARPIFYPLSCQPPYLNRVNNPVACELSNHGVNLPSSSKLTEKDVDTICKILLKIC